ncbi:unnamed protein product [Polarella glacialis]|uniref:Uncharacterized protein n=1 Tax=Polarella glacialis TaxID=89957 RepID=A0A813M5X9_POLGL|nr:unnamed protein product [Polarella glacialis]
MLDVGHQVAFSFSSLSGHNLQQRLVMLEDEIGPQVRCNPFPPAAPARDLVLQDPQLLLRVINAAGLPTAHCCRSVRRVLGRDLSSAMPALYASALPSIYVIGGACRMEGVLNSVQRLDSGGSAWEVVSSMPTARRLCSATACGGRLYVCGGETVASAGVQGVMGFLPYLDGVLREYAQLDSVECFDPLQGSWEVLPPMPSARAGCSATAADGLLYVCGGRWGQTVLSVVERYDPAVRRWERLPRMPTARSGCSAVTANGRVYVLGGKCDNGRVQGVTERFDSSFGRWSKLPAMLTPRSAFAAGVIADVLYAAGGFNGSVGLDTVERFDPQFGHWDAQPPMGISRVGGAAAVAGGQLYIFGGKSAELHKALSGLRFDPAQQRWLSVPSMLDRQVYCAGAAAVSASSPLPFDCDGLFNPTSRNSRLGKLNTCSRPQRFP